MLHCNVTAQPTAAWTLRQFRESLPGDGQCQFLIHDRDSIFSPSLDRELERIWSPGTADAGSGDASQRLLRTIGGNDPA
jgi:hypothetical protein